jgi:transcriptional regulator with XRE-family HTH domain
MAKTFGQYLEELRLSVKPKKLSQQQLGTVINSTRQYIDAIEKSTGKTSPPRYALLLKMIDRLMLTPAQKQTFLWLAFKERIQNNWDLYTYLHKGAISVNNNASHDASHKNNESQFPFTYSLKFTIETGSISKESQSQLRLAITKACSAYHLASLTVNDTNVFLTLGISVTDSIQDIIATLKKATPPTVTWDADVQICTVGAIPDSWLQFTVAKTKKATKTSRV